MAPRTRSSRLGADIEQDNESVSEKAPKQTASTRNKDKIYRKETARPELKQLQFPARNTTVRPKKTYGKKRHSLPPHLPPSTSKRSGKVKDEDPRQSTLTQIGWVPSTFPEDDDEIEPLSIDLTADGSASDHDSGKAKSTRNPRRKKAGGKRRRTMGDLELERDQEDGENTLPRSSFHTQTLTQMPSWMQSGEEEEDVDEMFVGNYDDELDNPTAGAEDMSVATPPSKRRKRPSPPQPKSQQPSRSLSQGSAILQTPVKQYIPPAEIPSSQPSPFTPNLAIERRGWSPLAEGTERTPLKNRSTNVGAPTPLANGKVLKRMRSDIPDSYSTVNGGMNSTPSAKRTPLKDITPWEGTADASVDEAEPADEARVQAQDINRPPQKSQRPQDEVIVDSDDEFEIPGEEPEAPGTPTPVRRALVEENISENVNSPVVGVAAPTPSEGRGMTDTNTSFLKETVAVEQLDVEKSSPTLFMPQQQSSNPKSRPTKDFNPAVEEDVTDPETPSQRRRRPSSSSVAERETPLSSLQKTSPAMPPISQLGYKSQGFESQRVPFEVIRQMAPQTDRSDVILSIHSDHVKEITDGTKTHEFRNYKIPQTVARIWIYITRPVCHLKYMATLGEVKLPGEISLDDLGIGNKDFNEGKGSKFAYELKQVYQLNNPVSLAQMKENGWVEEAPVRYVYVPPAVLGELMGNLQRALFLEPGELVQQPTQQMDDVTISRELEKQLRTDITHSTQLMRIASSPRPAQTKVGEKDINIRSSSPDVNTEEDEEGHIAETPTRSARRPIGRQVAFAKTTTIGASTSGSQLSLVEDSPPPPKTRVASSQSQRRAAVRPSQATTASASSQSQRLPSQLNRTQREHLRNSHNSQRLSVPVSPSPSRKQRTPEARPSSSSSLPEPPVEDDDDILVVDDSPVVPRGRGRGHDTQSTLELGLPLGSSSQAIGGLSLGGEQDSLMDDSRIRKPPSEIAWDSDGEELE